MIRPDYVSRETGARLLDMSADTWDAMVARGRLPKPVMVGINGTTPRWRWADVEKALQAPSTSSDDDPDDEPFFPGGGTWHGQGRAAWRCLMGSRLSASRTAPPITIGRRGGARQEPGRAWRSEKTRHIPISGRRLPALQASRSRRRGDRSMPSSPNFAPARNGHCSGRGRGRIIRCTSAAYPMRPETGRWPRSPSRTCTDGATPWPTLRLPPTT